MARARRERVIGRVDTDAFIRDGYVAVRGAFGAGTAAACREMIWDMLRERGMSPDDHATWAPPLVRIGCPEGEPFAAAGTSPRLHAAYDELSRRGPVDPAAGVGGTGAIVQGLAQARRTPGPAPAQAGRPRAFSVPCR